jgi:polysaccharide biosynthesis protein PslH
MCPMRILWISPRQCWPPCSGAKLRDYHCAKALGNAAQLTYVHFRDPGAKSPSSTDMPFCRRIISVNKPPSYTVGKLIRGVVGPWPLPILNYYSAEMAAVIEQVRREENFDIVHFDGVHMASYEPLFRNSSHPDTRCVFDWHNIESEAMKRYTVETKSVAKKLYARTMVPRLQELEIALLKNAFGHIVCSKREEAELRTRVPGARVIVIPNGVDTASYTNTAAGLRWPPRSIIFVGAMNYYPNIDAAISFAREVWPRFLSLFPGCRLTLVGSDPVPAVLALRDIEGVEVTGTVDDVRRFYRDADVALVPLRLGGGTRLKILEAMAAGVPVISTSVGAEGLDVQPGLNILIADERDPETWVRAMISLGESDRRREEMTASARQLVRERYEWTVIGTLLRETYLNWRDSDR